jgi:hypothetical protein
MPIEQLFFSASRREMRRFGAPHLRLSARDGAVEQIEAEDYRKKSQCRQTTRNAF